MIIGPIQATDGKPFLLKIIFIFIKNFKNFSNYFKYYIDSRKNICRNEICETFSKFKKICS
jgi:hypothetical protein